MKLLKVLSISFLLSLSFLVTPVFAAETPVASPTGQGQSVLLAKVNIKDAKILLQEKNYFDISFSITNEMGVQNGVKYGVQLVEQTDKGPFIVDEKVYDESLTLPENSTVTKKISYVAPAILNGTYKLFLVSKNTSGFTFDYSYVGQVKISSLTKGVEISPESCTVSIIGDKTNTQYKLGQQLSILPTQDLNLVCTVVNGSDKTVESTPSFATTDKTVYGKSISVGEKKLASIILKAKESKSFSVIIPKATIPNLYYVNMSLKSGDTSSNSVGTQYFIRGNVATIENLSLDKDSYRYFDTAKLTLVWNYLAADNSTTNNSVIFNAVITDGENKECANPYTKTLVQDFANPKIEIPISINKTCYNPTVLVTLKDASGNTLDEKSFKTETVSNKTESANSYIYYIIIAIVLLLIVGYIVYKKKKGNAPNIILPIIFLIALISVIPGGKVSADTYSLTYNPSGGSNYWQGGYTISINKTSVAPGEPVYATGSLWFNGSNLGSPCPTGTAMTVSTPANPTEILILNSNGGTATQAVFGSGPAYSQPDHVNFFTYFGTKYSNALYFTYTTPVVPPASDPKVDLKVYDANGVLIPKDSNNITTRSIKSKDKITLHYDATNFTGSITCTLPNGSKISNTSYDITLNPGPTLTSAYTVSCATVTVPPYAIFWGSTTGTSSSSACGAYTSSRPYFTNPGTPTTGKILYFDSAQTQPVNTFGGGASFAVTDSAGKKWNFQIIPTGQLVNVTAC